MSIFKSLVKASQEANLRQSTLTVNMFTTRPQRLFDHTVYLWDGTEVEDRLVLQLRHVGDAVGNQFQSIGDEFIQTVDSLPAILLCSQVDQSVFILAPNLKHKRNLQTL